MLVSKSFMVSVLGLEWDPSARLKLSELKQILKKLFHKDYAKYLMGGYAREAYYFSSYVKTISLELAQLLQVYRSSCQEKKLEHQSFIEQVIQNLDLGQYAEDHFTNILIAAERKLLSSKHIAGVILFRHNDSCKTQLQALTNGIKSLNPSLFIAVDQEGGMVQRLVSAFTKKMPQLKDIRAEYENSAHKADYLLELELMSETYSKELLALGVTHNLAPVCDLDLGCSVISDLGRSAGSEITSTTKILQALISGMQKAGIIFCLKHFPGHGGATTDSHFAPSIYSNEQDLTLELELFKNIISFCRSKNFTYLIMPAHVTYPSIDPTDIATRSNKILQLARNFGFTGDFISDCVTMKGACQQSDLLAIAKSCLELKEIKIITICHYDPIKYLQLFEVIDDMFLGNKPTAVDDGLVCGTTDVGATFESG